MYECPHMREVLIDELVSRFEGIIDDSTKLNRVREYYKDKSFGILCVAVRNGHGPESARKHGCKNRAFKPKVLTK